MLKVLLQPGARYEHRKKEVALLNELVDRNEETCAAVAALVKICIRDPRTFYMTVNNKFEGCAPLSICGITECIVGCVLRRVRDSL